MWAAPAGVVQQSPANLGGAFVEEACEVGSKAVVEYNGVVSLVERKQVDASLK